MNNRGQTTVLKRGLMGNRGLSPITPPARLPSRSDPAWHFLELKTGHDAMILVPDDPAALLLQSAPLK